MSIVRYVFCAAAPFNEKEQIYCTYGKNMGLAPRASIVNAVFMLWLLCMRVRIFFEV